MKKNLILKLILLFFVYLLLPTRAVATFQKSSASPILDIGSSVEWDSFGVTDPYILQEEDDTYKMWYSGTTGGFNTKIGLATSTDGISWQKLPTNPIFSKDLNDSSELEVSLPKILKIGDEYKMWYLSTITYTEPGNEVYRIKLATSPNGIDSWTLHGIVFQRSTETWESEGVVPNTVLFHNNEYHLWYSARDSIGTWRIGYAVSNDGINWNRQSDPVLTANQSWEGTTVAAANVIIQEGTYHMYYHAGLVIPFNIGHATSSDGINWTKDEDPILERGNCFLGDFDCNMIAAPSVIRDANKLRMYYAGHDAATWRIGLAEEVVPVPYFSQTDPLWGTDEYDHASLWANPGSTTMSSLGCAVTSAAMVLAHFNVLKTPGDTESGLDAKDLTPGTLNEWMKTRDDASFRNGATNWALIAAMTQMSHDLDSTSPTLEYFSSPSASLNTVLEGDQPAILNLDYPPSPSDAHFVVATKKQDDTYTINDPFYPDRTTLSPYYDTINNIGYYQLTNTDFSYLIYAVEPSVTLSLKDESGNEKGEQFIQKPVYDVQNQVSSGADELKMLFLKQPRLTTYTLTVASSSAETYQLDSYFYDQLGDGDFEIIKGFVGPNDTDTFQLTVDPTSQDNSFWHEDMTFTEFKQDIQSAYNSGWIADQLTYNYLMGQAILAERLVERGQNGAAKILLKAFVTELKILRDKKITDEAFYLLKTDASSLIKTL